jgi:3-oxoacyl-[acyl-carrier-protein] synthase-1
VLVAITGMVCAVGLSAPAASAAKRAGISGLEDLPQLLAAGEPVVVGAVPDPELPEQGSARLLELLVRPLREIAAAWHGWAPARTALMACLPERERPGAGTLALERVLERARAVLGFRPGAWGSCVVATGHTAAFDALRVARELLRRGDVDACIVCGADSLLSEPTLRWLDRTHRLKTPANRDGVIPGEAGVAAVVTMAEAPGSTHAVSEIVGLGHAREAAHLLSGEPLLAEGLTAATRVALAEAGIGLHDVDLRVSDVTGELYGFKELALLEGRLMRVVRKREQPVWHWVEAIGDTGAAAGLAQLVLLDQAFRRGYAPGDLALCLTSALDGARAVAVVRRRPTALPPVRA